MTDLAVSTPLGEGTLLLARYMKGKTFVYLVRLPVTPEVSEHLRDPNCLDKNAKQTARFSFTAEELGLLEEQK